MLLMNVHGTVVGVIHDQVLVRYESCGVIFLKDALNKLYKLDDIVQFSAKPATATDIAVAESLSRSTKYEVRYRGHEIKLVKGGRTLQGEGQILTMDSKGEFLFVDWRFTAKPPMSTKVQNQVVNTNVFCTKAAVRPECTNVNTVFKVGDRVKFVAKEQAANKKGVCWRAALITHPSNTIQAVDSGTRTTYQIMKKEESSSVQKSSSNGQKNLRPDTNKPSSSVASDSNGFEVPPPINGYEFYDCSPQACEARYRAFINDYRLEHPNDTISKPIFEGLLQIKYLQHVQEVMQAIRAVK